MNEDEAFIRAIVNSPGDDLPRLVYADWLDDRDDPRGAYLRAELALYRFHDQAPRSRHDIPQKEKDAVRRAFAQEQGTKRQALREQGSPLDPVWVARISRPGIGLCLDGVRFIDCGPRLTVADLERAQRELNRPFPAEYQAFLLNYNAGTPIPFKEPPPEQRRETFGSPVKRLFPLGNGGDISNLWSVGMETVLKGLHEITARTPLPDADRAVLAAAIPLGFDTHYDCVRPLFLEAGASATGQVLAIDEQFPQGQDDSAEVYPHFRSLTAFLDCIQFQIKWKYLTRAERMKAQHSPNESTESKE